MPSTSNHDMFLWVWSVIRTSVYSWWLSGNKYSNIGPNYYIFDIYFFDAGSLMVSPCNGNKISLPRFEFLFNPKSCKSISSLAKTYPTKFIVEWVLKKMLFLNLFQNLRRKVLPQLVGPVSKMLLYFLRPLISAVMIAYENVNGSIPYRKCNSKAEINWLDPAPHGFAADLSISSMRFALLRSSLAGEDCINHVFVINSQIFFLV